jgi:hypothetical protein
MNCSKHILPPPLPLTACDLGVSDGPD